jgi:hypothetical protein
MIINPKYNNLKNLEAKIKQYEEEYNKHKIIFLLMRLNNLNNKYGAADFVDVGRALITLKDKGHEIAVIQQLEAQLEFTLGDAFRVPELSLFRVILPLGRRFSVEQRATISESAHQIAKANAQAQLVPGGGSLYRVQVKLDFEFKVNMRTEAMARTTLMSAERQLISLLGGAPFGIMAAAIAVNPASNAVQWSDEHSIYIQGDQMVRNLIDQLSTGQGIRGATRGASADVIKKVRMLKNCPPVVTKIKQERAARESNRKRNFYQ